MANGLDIRVVVKDQIKETKNVALLLHQWAKGGKPAEVDSAYAEDVNRLAEAGLITGKAGSIFVHLRTGGGRLIVLGLGENEKVSPESYRTAGAALAKLARDQKLPTLAVISPSEPAALATGFALRGFEYTDYKGTATNGDKTSPEVTLTLVGQYTSEQKKEIDRAVIIANAQNYARTIASRPGNDINPPSLAKAAEQLAKEVGLGVTILDEKKMKQLGMGGILGVGGGSTASPPRMIVLEWNGLGKAKSEDRGSRIEDRKTRAAKRDSQSSILNPQSSTLLVVGKAITFDTGGISIKGAAGMQKMIFDKCGGMAVLGLMHAIANLKLKCRVVGILASAENHISDTAYRPGDILKMYNGVTVEVTNTDAEGRLVLGDALAWGIETYKPAAVVDLATLTGGVVVALGKTMAGIMSNNDGIVTELEAAAKLTGEKMWRLPIGEDQRDLLKSDFADIVNSGAREAHPLQGGAFLSYFVPEKLPWAHIDIAGVADTEKELPLSAKGATGWGVRTLVEWVTARCK
jgi:leucyl aminopeptidase